MLTLNLIARVPSFKTSINSSGFVNSGDLYSQNTNDLGRQSVVFTATTTTTYLVLISNTTTAGKSVSFDNVSVREMPVIKWAPHNLLRWSEDVSQSGTYVDFGSTGFVTFVDEETITFDAQNSAQAANTTASTSNLVGQTLTGVVELSSQTDAGKDVKVKLNWRGGASYEEIYTLTTTPTLVAVTQEVPSGATGVDLVISNTGIGTAKTFTASKWHLYRSDLGGMVDNPERGDSYVPTTSSALYLPRIGHHVYNGSAWVNEGVLAESESRTNLVKYSEDLNNTTVWTKANDITVTAVDDGLGVKMWDLDDSSTNFSSLVQNVSTSNSTTNDILNRISSFCSSVVHGNIIV